MMAQVVIAALLAASAVTLATIVGWGVCGLGSLVAGRARRRAAPARARLLAQVRLLPLMLVSTLVPLQIYAFWRFEAGGPESAGPLLLVTAAAGMILMGDFMVSGLRAWRQTRATIAIWRRTAVPLSLPHWTGPAWTIDSAFPIVAVVGVMRPALYVARQVIRECTPEELAAIAAHEAAHARARDNFVRALYRLTPGAGLAAGMAARLEREWTMASEESADLHARRATSGLELASALLKVARLASGRPGEMLPASALIGDSDLESRVRRLLDPPSSGRERAFLVMPAALLTASLAVVASPRALASLHELFELLVRR